MTFYITFLHVFFEGFVISVIEWAIVSPSGRGWRCLTSHWASRWSSAEAHCHTRVMSSDFTTHAELWGATIYTNGSSRTSLAALTCCPRDRDRWLKAVLCPARAGAPKTGKKRVELKPPRMRNLIEPSQPAAYKSTFVSLSFFPNSLAIWTTYNRYLSTCPEEVKCKTGFTNPKFA